MSGLLHAGHCATCLRSAGVLAARHCIKVLSSCCPSLFKPLNRWTPQLAIRFTGTSSNTCAAAGWHGVDGGAVLAPGCSDLLGTLAISSVLALGVLLPMYVLWWSERQSKARFLRSLGRELRNEAPLLSPLCASLSASSWWPGSGGALAAPVLAVAACHLLWLAAEVLRSLAPIEAMGT